MGCCADGWVLMTEANHEPRPSTPIVRDFLSGALQAIIIRPLRTGTFALGRHDGSTAGFAIVVGALYALTLVAILCGAWLRSTTELVSGQDGSSRTVVPVPLVPAVLLLVGIAMALLLAGAQRCRWWLRILALVTALAVLGALVVDAAARDRGPVLLIAIIGLLGTVLASVWSWVTAPRLAVQSLALVVAVETCMVASYRSLVAGGEGLDLPYEVLQTSAILGIFILLVTPLAFLGGLKTVAFGVSMCTWSAAFARTRLTLRSGRILMVVVLIGAGTLAGWSWWSALVTTSAIGPWLLRTYLMPIAIVALGIGCWWLVQRIPARRSNPVRQSVQSRKGSPLAEDVSEDEGRVPEAVVDDAARTLALPTSLAFLASALIGVPLLIVRRLLIDVFPSNPLLDGLVTAVRGEQVLTATRWLACIGIAAGCIWLARTGRSLMAGIAAVSTVMLTAFLLVQPGAPLGDWAWSVDALGDLGTVSAMVLAVAFAGRRCLSLERVQIVILIALLSMLARQADFFTVPFSFIAGIAGSAFLIFGLVWGFLTDGGGAQRDSVGYPRNARMLMFLGQALFGISIVAWATIGRRTLDAQTLSDFASISVQTLGTALILATICYAWRVVARVDRVPSKGDEVGRMYAASW